MEIKEPSKPLRVRFTSGRMSPTEANPEDSNPMKSLKPILLASALALGATMTAAVPTSAAPVSSITANAVSEQTRTVSQLPVELVAHRNYNRHRHGHRHRTRRPTHRHFYRGYWYAYPWWLHAVPRYYNRCDYWARQCSRRWGRGADYRGCMRHHGCRP